MKVLVISLQSKPERAARVTARLDALGVPHDVFSAVDGTRGEHEAWQQYDEAACLREFGKGLLPAEIGCFASHYSIWQQCANEGVPILVLEDDVTILDGFPDALEIAQAHLEDRQLIRLAGLTRRPFRQVKGLGGRNLVRFLRGPEGTQAYMLAPEGAEALLRAATRWIRPVDHFLDRFWVHRVLPYAVLPFEIIHTKDAERTSTIGNRWTKRRGWMKVRRELNKFRDDISRWVFNFRN
ncbi:glycosyltransferase family 25 protein [Oricola sp.]|uniref:glycosyltransferase family 25 protein n=1 Tax=Oricola sp. TaxID=1979950 RepID=UPI003BA9E060